jgi:hypothetical protein
MAGQNSPNQFTIIQRGQTLSGIAASFPGVRSQQQIHAKVRELVRINPHITNPDRIYAGKVLNLGSTSGLQVTPFAADLLEMERIFNQDPALTDRLLENWETALVLDRVGVTPAPGKSLLPSKGGLAYKALKTAREAGVKAATGKFGNLVKVSPHVWRSAEGALVNNIRENIRYLKQSNGALGLVPSGSRAFQQGSKVFVVSPGPSGGFSAFSDTVKSGKNFSKNFLQPAKKALKVIDLGMSGYNIYRDWGTADQNRTILKESVKTAFSAVSKSYKSAAAVGVCTLLTVTTGAGGVVCFVSVYLVSSVVESAILDAGSDYVYELGGEYYHQVYQSSAPQSLSH